MAGHDDKYAYNAVGAGQVPNYGSVDGTISAVGAPGLSETWAHNSSGSPVELGDVATGLAEDVPVTSMSDMDGGWATVGGPEQIKA